MTMQGKIFQALDWLLYILLLAVALYFIIESEVLNTFSEKWTDFHNHEDSQSNSSQPSIMACIKQDNSSVIDQTDLTIQYEVQDDLNQMYENLSEEVSVERIEYYFMSNCMTINLPSKFAITESMKHVLTFEFNTSISKDKIPHVEVYITSDFNIQYLGKYFDGDPLMYKVAPNTYLEAEIKEKQIRYLQNGECRNVSFFRYLALAVNQTSMENCSEKCIPYSSKSGIKEIDDLLSNITMCKTEVDSNCSKKWFSNVVMEAKKPCKKVEYSGRSHISVTSEDHVVKFAYSFSLPRTTIVFDEYLILDTIAMIGSIGGTLGLFVGFSFSNVSSYVINAMKTLITKNKTTSIKTSKDLNLTNEEILKIRIILANWDNLPIPKDPN